MMSQSMGQQSANAKSATVRLDESTEIKNQLIRQINQLIETGHEYNELTDLRSEINKTLNTLNQKKRQSEIIEALAMNSDDANIKELRSALFAATKLIHATEIKELTVDEKSDGEDVAYASSYIYAKTPSDQMKTRSLSDRAMSDIYSDKSSVREKWTKLFKGLKK